MPELNFVATDPQDTTGASGLIQRPYVGTARDGYNYGAAMTPAGTGFMEYGSGTPGSLPFRVDQNGNMFGTNVGGLIPSGDPTGATDTANINALVALGARVVALGPGQFYINSGLSLAASTWLHGAGTGATVLTPASGFTGTAVIQMPSGGYSRVSDLSIVGASATIASNPACNGIEGGTGRYNRVDNVFGQYINGWLGEDLSAGINVGYASMWTNVSGLMCAGGLHFQGVSGSSFGGQYFISNLNLQQIGISATNLDAVKIEDCTDILISGYNGAVAGSGQTFGPSDVNTGGTGSALNLKGDCATIYADNLDLGCFPHAVTITNSTVTIQTSTNGNPNDIRLSKLTGQQSAVGITITAGSDIKILQSRFTNNFAHGAVVSGSGTDVIFEGCRFGQNGQQAGTYYDLNWSGSATGFVRLSHFMSAIGSAGSVGAGQVTQSVNIATGGQDVQFTGCVFRGTGATGFSSAFSHIPSVVRNCPGCNPHGAVTVAVPATTGSTTALGYDSVFYITAGAAACTVQRGSGPPVTIPASACVPVFVPAGSALTYNYSSAPTQVVDGQ